MCYSDVDLLVEQSTNLMMINLQPPTGGHDV
jgi:hypothetical protein